MKKSFLVFFEYIIGSPIGKFPNRPMVRRSRSNGVKLPLVFHLDRFVDFRES